jgi:hypothetical protein
MCLALGVDSLDDAAAKLGSVREDPAATGLAEKVRGPRTMKSIADLRLRTVRRHRRGRLPHH